MKRNVSLQAKHWKFVHLISFEAKENNIFLIFEHFGEPAMAGTDETTTQSILQLAEEISATRADLPKTKSDLFLTSTHLSIWSRGLTIRGLLII